MEPLNLLIFKILQSFGEGILVFKIFEDRPLFELKTKFRANKKRADPEMNLDIGSAIALPRPK